MLIHTHLVVSFFFTLCCSVFDATSKDLKSLSPRELLNKLFYAFAIIVSIGVYDIHVTLIGVFLIMLGFYLPWRKVVFAARQGRRIRPSERYFWVITRNPYIALAWRGFLSGIPILIYGFLSHRSRLLALPFIFTFVLPLSIFLTVKFFRHSRKFWEYLPLIRGTLVGLICFLFNLVFTFVLNMPPH